MELQLEVRVQGRDPFSYQWYRNGVALADDGRTQRSREAQLRVAGVSSNDAGDYQVVVGNAVGVCTSQVAKATVLLPGQLVWKVSLGTGEMPVSPVVEPDGTVYLGTG